MQTPLFVEDLRISRHPLNIHPTTKATTGGLVVDAGLQFIDLDGVFIGVGDQADPEVLIGEAARTPAVAPGSALSTDGDHGV